MTKEIQTNTNQPDSELVCMKEGYLSTDNEKRHNLFFPKAELLNIGCKNCVWKLNHQCPHNLKGEEIKHYGICDELVQFVSSLADKDDSLTAVWEKFHIYKARLQEAADYKDFVRLSEKIAEKDVDGCDDEELANLRMNRTAAKIWWIRLNDHVVKSLQKVVDREYKGKTEGKLPGILSAKTINFNVKQVEDKSE